MSTPTHPFIAHDQAFAAVLGAAPRLVKVVDVDAHEGPVYVADEDALYFTTLPRPTCHWPGRERLPSSAWRSTATASRSARSTCRPSVVRPATQLAQ